MLMVRPAPQKPLKGWQQWILLGYAGFFALVLPFLCWGSAGNPGHAHTQAHLIFVEPHAHPTTAAQYLWVVQRSRLHLHTVAEVMAGHSHVHPQSIVTQGQTVGLLSQDDPSVTSSSHLDLHSTAELSGLSLLLILLLGLWTMRQGLLGLFPILLAHPFPRLAIPTVPVPPPRHYTACCR